MNEILTVSALHKRFGGVTASDDIDLSVTDNEVHAVIGPNGAGKTTLVAQLAGAVHPDSGRIEFRGRNITRMPAYRRARLGLARSFQITSVFLDMSVLENTMLAVQGRPNEGHSFRFWRPTRRDARLREPGFSALQRVGLADQANRLARELSHGEHRQLEIAMALAMEPTLLLLDEPMAGIGTEESARMVQLLSALKETTPMLLIEHDMDAVFALADRITVLVYGRAIATGTPAEIRADEAVQRAYLGHEDSGV